MRGSINLLAARPSNPGWIEAPPSDKHQQPDTSLKGIGEYSLPG